MMRRVILLWGFFISFPGHAALIQAHAHGFHWYSTEPTEKTQKLIPTPAAAPTPSPYEKLMNVRHQTLNTLATALIEPSFDATYDYMVAQQQYAKKNQQFVRYWQQVLMVHPELDYTLHAPTDNSAIATRNDSQNLTLDKVLKASAATYGLILFYKGNSSISQKMMVHLMPFVNEYHFSMISVATDGQSIDGLPNPKTIPLAVVQKTIDIKARYMPALFLVNLKTKKMSALSYGFVSLTELKTKFLDVVTNYKRLSYEGLEES
jgi:conjugal transfer pilus assembly protein TraF